MLLIHHMVGICHMFAHDLYSQPWLLQEWREVILLHSSSNWTSAQTDCCYSNGGQISLRESLNKPPNKFRHKHLIKKCHPQLNTTPQSRCDGVSDVRTESDTNLKWSKEAEAVASKCSQQECEVESVHKELNENICRWNVPRLKIWTHCIVSGVYIDYDNICMIALHFSSTTPKRAWWKSFSYAMSGAAVTIVKALSVLKKETAKFLPSCSGASEPGMSLSKAVDIYTNEELYTAEVPFHNFMRIIFWTNTSIQNKRTRYWPFWKQMLGTHAQTLCYKVHSPLFSCSNLEVLLPAEIPGVKEVNTVSLVCVTSFSINISVTA